MITIYCINTKLLLIIIIIIIIYFKDHILPCQTSKVQHNKADVTKTLLLLLLFYILLFLFMCSFVSTFRYLLQTKLSSSLIIFKRQYSTICQTAKVQHIEADVKKKKKKNCTAPHIGRLVLSIGAGQNGFASLHRGTWLRC